ncbi:MAG: hypothetical protein HYR67_10420 [Bacteroidetes bacterium]|nr:hypothetical protein [Bacteroidota bacterium]
MELRDLIVTPLILAGVLLFAFLIRPSVTDQITRKYFFPALVLRIAGALAVGLIYQFYYTGGDTFNYHTNGSRILWEAFVQSPYIGFKLFFGDQNVAGGYAFVSKMPFFTDPSSFAVIQLAAFFDLFTFSSYSGTAILFAVLGFIGSWMMFQTFYDLYPHLHKWLAWSIFFIPSVLFWGSGILKDTITFACVGITLYCTYALFIKKRFKVVTIVLILASTLLLYKIKIYILLTFVPAMILWVFFENLSKIRNRITRVFAAPLVILVAGSLAVFAALKAGEDNPKYALNKLAETAQVTAYDIRYWTGRAGGSGYSLGELDGTFNSMVKLAPQAIVVSLFRPFIWEVNNPLMFISAIEAFLFLFFLIIVMMRSNFFFLKALSNPTVVFCLGFSLIFAFAVGVSTYNFGTLVRYKIPMLPFFIIALVLIDDLSRQERIKRLG